MDKPRRLTDEQKQMVEALKAGFGIKEIMIKFGITAPCVYVRIRTLCKKYKIDTRERLVVFLLKQEFEERLERIKEMIYPTEASNSSPDSKSSV